jgi:hypothetical protein
MQILRGRRPRFSAAVDEGTWADPRRGQAQYMVGQSRIPGQLQNHVRAAPGRIAQPGRRTPEHPPEAPQAPGDTPARAGQRLGDIAPAVKTQTWDRALIVEGGPRPRGRESARLRLPVSPNSSFGNSNLPNSTRNTKSRGGGVVHIRPTLREECCRIIPPPPLKPISSRQYTE